MFTGNKFITGLDIRKKNRIIASVLIYKNNKNRLSNTWEEIQLKTFDPDVWCIFFTLNGKF